jgi:hypothetical protein
VFNDGLDAWRNAMFHLFLNPSPLLVAGEVLVGMSLPMFVAALIAAFGDRIWLRPPLGRFHGSLGGNSEAGKALGATSSERRCEPFAPPRRPLPLVSSLPPRSNLNSFSSAFNSGGRS